jgi:ribonuclease P protein component
MHLRISQDFERIYAVGQRAGDEHLLIFATANDLNVARLGLSISRKHGSAVRRNLKRRRIREAFRHLQYDLPQSYDLIVVPRHRDDSTLQDFRNSLRTLIRKLAKRITALQSEFPAASPGLDSGANP